MKKKEEIKIEVRYTEGYEKRFTEACLKQLRKRREKERAEMQAEKTA